MIIHLHQDSQKLFVIHDAFIAFQKIQHGEFRILSSLDVNHQNYSGCHTISSIKLKTMT